MGQSEVGVPPDIVNLSPTFVESISVLLAVSGIVFAIRLPKDPPTSLPTNLDNYRHFSWIGSIAGSAQKFLIHGWGRKMSYNDPKIQYHYRQSR